MLEVHYSLMFVLYSCRLSLTMLLLFTAASATAISTLVKPGCPTKCGNLIVPYPFGSSPDGYSCSLSKWYEITCNTSFSPPKPVWGPNNLEVVGISQAGQMRIKNAMARECNDDVGDSNVLIAEASINLKASLVDNKAIPFVFSDTENKLIVTGCDRIGMIAEPKSLRTVSACISMCSDQEKLLKHNGSCSGVGCCQTIIPKGLTMLQFYLGSIGNLSTEVRRDLSSCSHAFLGENDKYTFNVDDLSDPSFFNRTRDDVPIVLEWVVGVDETCSEAEKNPNSYACKDNTICTDIDISLRGGYRCSCLDGYEGNPYLSPGCTDIDECAKSSSNLCSDICTNTPGSFICSCPKGHRGDGLKTGKGCIRNHPQFVMTFSLGASFGFLLLLISVWIYFTMRRRRLLKVRENFFDQNGGLILKQQLSPTELSRIFSEEELQTATNNYSEDRILGKGGFGTVYKGILKDGSEVAIKKPLLDDQDKTQVQEFINEVVILMQTNHKNVVKILGCCLETKVPLLVYEFISNGTLFEHIKNRGTSWLNWENCIRVASEIVDALAYLHSAALTPIIHRDIKSANILLDGSYTAKIADFGASMLAPIGQTLPIKRVPGTYGYLDPQSLQTGRLTEKSDVYSFGVVLAELLTKEKAISSERTGEEASLARYFVSSMKRQRLLEILDPQLVNQASAEQLLSVSELVIKCLEVDSGNRPTMREVAVELEGLKKKVNHPWEISEQSCDETTSLVSQQHSEDLYPVSSVGFSSNTADFP